MGKKGGREGGVKGNFCEDQSAVSPDLTHWVDLDWRTASYQFDILKTFPGPAFTYTYRGQ